MDAIETIHTVTVKFEVNEILAIVKDLQDAQAFLVESSERIIADSTRQGVPDNAQAFVRLGQEHLASAQRVGIRATCFEALLKV